jgi:hypothetical protein
MTKHFQLFDEIHHKATFDPISSINSLRVYNVFKHFAFYLTLFKHFTFL